MDDLTARLPVRVPVPGRRYWTAAAVLHALGLGLALVVVQQWFLVALSAALTATAVLQAALPGRRLDARGLHAPLGRGLVPWSDVVEVTGVSRWRTAPELVLADGTLVPLPADLPLSETDLRRLAGLDLGDDDPAPSSSRRTDGADG